MHVFKTEKNKQLLNCESQGPQERSYWEGGGKVAQHSTGDGRSGLRLCGA